MLVYLIYFVTIALALDPKMLKLIVGSQHGFVDPKKIVYIKNFSLSECVHRIYWG